MLTLGVKPGDYIVVGENVKIYVIKQEGELKFTVDAPREVRILRGEVYERMQAEGKLPWDAANNKPNLKRQEPRFAASRKSQVGSIK